MGLLDALWPADYRDIAMALKNYAVSKKLSGEERRILVELQIREDVFVREKILFVCSLIRACLIVQQNKGDETSGMVRVHYDTYTEEYFETLPGIGSKAGLNDYRDARGRYGTFLKDSMYAGFLERVKSDDSESDPQKAFDKAWVSPQQFAAFATVMDFCGKASIQFLSKQLGRLRRG